ncbi:hypothetical protein BV913_07290 [Neisseria dumasiana]|uniref:Uncharacterized protein n=1 Tax=Neisseria dumasiana TaxID=1931275 RepID=A0ABX3WM53_9NEIS|nr:hypothetical protein BV913_07290 [Neisseria dumasiana]
MSVNDNSIYIKDSFWFSPNTLFTIEMKTKNIENGINNDHFDSYMHFCKIHDEIFLDMMVALFQLNVIQNLTNGRIFYISFTQWVKAAVGATRRCRYNRLSSRQVH